MHNLFAKYIITKLMLFMFVIILLIVEHIYNHLLFFQGGTHCKRIRFFPILEYLFVTKLVNFLLVSK
jgi:hypothetical protein